MEFFLSFFSLVVTEIIVCRYGCVRVYMCNIMLMEFKIMHQYQCTFCLVFEIKEQAIFLFFFFFFCFVSHCNCIYSGFVKMCLCVCACIGVWCYFTFLVPLLKRNETTVENSTRDIKCFN